MTIVIIVIVKIAIRVVIVIVVIIVNSSNKSNDFQCEVGGLVSVSQSARCRTT